ncbi:MAG TPA: hypothetical protein VF252_13210 [Gemmatimonadales bacterium]
MAKNLGRKYATMSEHDRNRFRVEESEGVSDRPDALDFEEPREKEGSQFASVKAEFADPEHRDGLGAVLDDEAHRKAVEKEARRQGVPSPYRDPRK